MAVNDDMFKHQKQVYVRKKRGKTLIGIGKKSLLPIKEILDIV